MQKSGSLFLVVTCGLCVFCLLVCFDQLQSVSFALFYFIIIPRNLFFIIKDKKEWIRMDGELRKKWEWSDKKQA